MRLVAVGALAAALLSAPAAALTVTDQTGRRITLPTAPARIISLVPSVTEILYSIGAQDRLVGVTDFCDYPPEARRKPHVGGMLAPSLEGMVSLKPDLVVATSAGNRQETFDQLERLRIPVYVVNPVAVADVLDLIGRLGRLTDRGEAADRTVAALRERVRAVTARVEGRPRLRVLYVLWPDPLMVPGRGSLVSELIALAGGESVTADGGDGYPRYSLEAALARNPDIIVLASHGSERSPLSRDQWERLRQVPAIAAGRLYTIDGNLTHRYGPRIVDGLERLARFIHPEAFGPADSR
ncbi:MAG TPA: cobalamin-binding protein [Methylomirabilota bacterium]|jgi:iron complex transport system substrate-binding protein